MSTAEMISAKADLTPTQPSSARIKSLQRKCACGQHTIAGGECEVCRKKRETNLQRAAISSPPVGEAPPIVHDVLRSPGQPLDAETRAFMEPRFGHDFSSVHVHTDARAAESARAVNALAYTVGRDVVFGAGQYLPRSDAGQQLLAHGLTHDGVVPPTSGRANGTIQAKLTIGASNDPLEQEADRIADQVLAAPAHAAVSGAPLYIQRYAGQSTGQADTAPASVDRVLASPGRPLGPALQQDMEQRFGHDFSRVRVHSGTAAEQSARDVNALAYTVGRNVVFGAGQYQPTTSEGRRLLAHELTHVVQQEQAGFGTIQRFAPEDAAEEMVGKTFLLNTDLKVSGQTLPKGSSVVITAWSNATTSVTADFKSGAKVTSVAIEKNFLVPVGDTKSGLSQYHAGVAGVEKKYARLEKKISDQGKEVSDWQAKEKKFTTTKGHAEWQRQMDVKQTELKDLKFKLTGAGHTSITLPERLKTTVGGNKVSIVPQSTLLNKALIEETMFNAFDASVVKWVAFYNKSIGSPKKWPALDANLVKSMLYQESHMGTHGDFLKLPPYTKGQRMTRFNIGQAIDSSGPQQILMIKEISPAIATKHNLDQVTKDMFAAQARRKELVAKGKAIDPTEQAELDTINSRSDNGKHWNNFFTSDPHWEAAVEEFFTETAQARNLDYDYWIHTAVRWLFEKRDGVKDWDAAIKAYNGTGAKAENYKKDVIGRRDAAKAATGDFIPKQHY